MSTTNKKVVTEGIRGAKEGVAECYDDMGGQTMTQGQETMSVTISMPGKNISVTSDSVDEIANILKLAGINVGGASAEETPTIAVEIPGMGAEAPEAELPAMGAQTMGQQPEIEMEPEQAEPTAEQPADGTEEPEVEEATKTPSSWEDSEGNKHPATKVQGKSYGNQDREEEEEEEVDEAILALRKLAGIQEAKDGPHGKPAWLIAKEKEAEAKEEGKEAEEEVEESAEEAPAPTSVVGQGIYEAEVEEATDESARILALAGVKVTEWANSPEGKADDKGTVENKLPSNVGQGGGNSQFGQNRANGQGENPMSPANTPNDSTIDVEEAFEVAMGEYRKFVSESIARSK